MVPVPWFAWLIGVSHGLWFLCAFDAVGVCQAGLLPHPTFSKMTAAMIQHGTGHLELTYRFAVWGQQQEIYLIDECNTSASDPLQAVDLEHSDTESNDSWSDQLNKPSKATLSKSAGPTAFLPLAQCRGPTTPPNDSCSVARPIEVTTSRLNAGQHATMRTMCSALWQSE